MNSPDNGLSIWKTLDCLTGHAVEIVALRLGLVGIEVSKVSLLVLVVLVHAHACLVHSGPSLSCLSLRLARSLKHEILWVVLVVLNFTGDMLAVRA